MEYRRSQKYGRSGREQENINFFRGSIGKESKHCQHIRLNEITTSGGSVNMVWKLG